MKKNLIFIIAITLTGCLSGGGGGGSSTSPSTDAPSAPGSGSSPPESDIPIAQAPSANQLSFTQISASTIYARGGDSIPLTFTVNNPVSSTVTCNWWVTYPPNPGLSFAGVAKTQEGTVNGPCAFTHNQINQLDKVVQVYVSNGETTVSYTWNIMYAATAPNQAVGIITGTATGTYYVYDKATFAVSVDDDDRDGACTWKIDGGATVSTSCLSYEISAASGNRTLVFRIDDGVTNATRSWSITPAAKVTSVTPAVVATAHGASQLFTATLTNTNSATNVCEVFVDGVSQGFSCVYNYTRSDYVNHEIKFKWNSGVGTVVNPATVTAVAAAPNNQSVSIDGYIPVPQELYYAQGVDTANYGVTYTDADGDARFEWYLNGVKTDCDVSTLCDYSSGNKNGIVVKSIQATTVIKVVLTDGQYSAQKSWIARIDTATIDTNQPVGTVCSNTGTTFWIQGSNFDANDVFTLQNTNVTLTKVQTTYGSVKLQIPQGMGNAVQKLRVTKSSGVVTETAFGYVSFHSSYCP